MILPVDDYDLWLDPAFKNADDLKELLRPFDASLMKRYPVSTRVNLVKNDDPDCALELKGINYGLAPLEDAPVSVRSVAVNSYPANLLLLNFSPRRTALIAVSSSLPASDLTR